MLDIFKNRLIIILAIILVLLFIRFYLQNQKRKQNPREDIEYLHPGLYQQKNAYGLGIYTSVDIPANTMLIKEKIHFVNNKNIWYDALLDSNLFFMLLDAKIRKMMNKELVDYDYIDYFNITYLLLKNNNKNDYLNLIPHQSDDSLDVEKYNYIKDYHLSYLSELDKDTMLLYLYKTERNCFAYSKNDKKEVSVAFYSSKFNHSCVPSADYELFEDEDVIVFTTNREIKANEEIFISYIDTTQYEDSVARMENLKQMYGFDCECDLCKGEL